MLEDIGAVERRHQGHWFDADTKRFFSSRVSQVAYNGGQGHSYFVSSEQRKWGECPQRKRLYTVRVQDTETGDIDTVGEFQGYETSRQAHAEAKRLAGQ